MDDALREKLLRIYADNKIIAVVGASADESKAANRIPHYLQTQGYVLRPVNPRGGTIFGEIAARTLLDVERPVDIVDVFRPADEAPEIARDAVEIGAKVLWLQEGIVSEEAKTIAEAAGLTVVMDHCIGATHHRLGLGPGPEPHA